jgi:hypothetical protein
LPLSNQGPIKFCKRSHDRQEQYGHGRVVAREGQPFLHKLDAILFSQGRGESDPPPIWAVNQTAIDYLSIPNNLRERRIAASQTFGVKRERNFLPDRASPERSRLRDTIIAALIAGIIMEAILSLLALVGLGNAVNELQAEALNGLKRLTPWALAEGYWDYIDLTFEPC